MCCVHAANLVNSIHRHAKPKQIAQHLTSTLPHTREIFVRIFTFFKHFRDFTSFLTCTILVHKALSCGFAHAMERQIEYKIKIDA